MMEHCHLEPNNPILWQSDQPTVGDGCFYISFPPLDHSYAYDYHFCVHPVPEFYHWVFRARGVIRIVLGVQFFHLFLVEYSLNTVSYARFEASIFIFKK